MNQYGSLLRAFTPDSTPILTAAFEGNVADTPMEKGAEIIGDILAEMVLLGAAITACAAKAFDKAGIADVESPEAIDALLTIRKIEQVDEKREQMHEVIDRFIDHYALQIAAERYHNDRGDA